MQKEPDLDDIESKPVKNYAVTLPVAGSITVFVKASSEEEALDKAYEEQDLRIKGSDNTEPGEFEVLKYIGRGNVNYAPCSEYSIEETGDG